MIMGRVGITSTLDPNVIPRARNIYNCFGSEDGFIFLTNLKMFVFLDLFQSLRRVPLLKIANSQYFSLAPFASLIGSLMRR